MVFLNCQDFLDCRDLLFKPSRSRLSIAIKSRQTDKSRPPSLNIINYDTSGQIQFGRSSFFCLPGRVLIVPISLRFLCCFLAQILNFALFRTKMMTTTMKEEAESFSTFEASLDNPLTFCSNN
jgi:hypothetical protein